MHNKPITCIEYDHNWVETARAAFATTKEAEDWASTRAKGTLFWDDIRGDVWEGMDEVTQQSATDTGNYPLEGHPIFHITGYEDEEEV